MNNQPKPDVTYFGQVNFRDNKTVFGIKEKDRFQHFYSIGQSGCGKSHLLKLMALSDIKAGNGLAVIDPHGDVGSILYEVAKEYRKEDVIYLDPTNEESLVSINPLQNIAEKDRYLAAANILGIFKKVWAEFWGVNLEHLLRHSLLTLMHKPDATLLNIRPLLTDPTYRKEVLDTIHDPEILAFWKKEYEQLSPSARLTAIAPILNKIGIFHSSVMKNIFGKADTNINMQEIMDNQKIFIANLSKGQIGDETTKMLGGMITTAFMNAALHRSSVPEEKRVPFFMYLDECGSLINSSIASILSESRKFKLSLFLCNQYLFQLDRDTQEAIFGNVATIVSFRLGSSDAPRIAREFSPYIDTQDLQNLKKYSFYCKVCIDGIASKPFSAKTLSL